MMIDETAILVPFWGDDPKRLRNLRLVQRYYEEFPGGVTVCPGPGRGRAVNAWLNRNPAHAGLVILNDADSLVDPVQLVEALRAVNLDTFVRAFTSYGYITEAQAEAANSPFEILIRPDFCGQHEISQSHGCAVAATSLLRDCGGYDPRFQGWGYEDLALDVMIAARYQQVRVPGTLCHLPHTPDPSGVGDAPKANEALYRRYEAEAGNWEGLRRLRCEAGDPLTRLRGFVESFRVLP